MPKPGENAPAAVDKPTEGNDSNPAITDKPGYKKPVAPVEPKPEATIEEALGKQEPDPEPKKDEVKMVPEAVFLELKKELKDLRKEFKAGNTPKSEISQSLKDLAEEYEIDPDFLGTLASAIRSETETEFNKKLEKELEPYKTQNQKQKAADFDKVFNEHFDAALDTMPEFKGIADKEAIKALVKDPKNANKTFKTIIEGAYGHLVKGKANIDAAKPGGGKDNAEIDFAKAAKDTEYFKSIMSNPELKKKYNEEMTQRNKF